MLGSKSGGSVAAPATGSHRVGLAECRLGRFCKKGSVMWPLHLPKPPQAHPGPTFLAAYEGPTLPGSVVCSSGGLQRLHREGVGVQN